MSTVTCVYCGGSNRRTDPSVPYPFCSAWCVDAWDDWSDPNSIWRDRDHPAGPATPEGSRRMIRNLIHALVSATLILVVGWSAGQPAFHRQLAGSQGARYAVLGLIVVLALLTVVSVARAFRPRRQPARRTSPYAAAPVKRNR